MNINPTIWGPHAWIFLHCITMAYPNCPNNEQKKCIRNFFTNLKDILPCDSCRENYQKHIQENPLTDEILHEKKKLIQWLINIHNLVNEKNGKDILSYDQVINKYIKGFKLNNNKIINNSSIILFFVVIIIIVITLANFIYTKFIKY